MNCFMIRYPTGIHFLSTWIGFWTASAGFGYLNSQVYRLESDLHKLKKDKSSSEID